MSWIALGQVVSRASPAALSHQEGRPLQKCVGELAGPFGADSVSPGGLVVVVDLDCDGHPDTVTLRWTTSGPDAGKLAIRVHGAKLNAEARILVDGEVHVIQVGDLNGDGVRDLVLAATDETVAVETLVVLVLRDKLLLAQFEKPLSTYYYDPMGHPECTLSMILPTIDRVAGGELQVTASYAKGDPSQDLGDCAKPPRHWWRVAGDTLRLVR